MVAVAISSDAHWRKLRSANVGGSECSALFGCCPYLTRFELWARKSDKLPPEEFDSERMFWGRVLESAIGEGIGLKTGWPVEKCGEYHVHDHVAGMGCTPDFLTAHPTRGPGLIQTKNVDRLEFLKWVDGEPPLHNLLQVQHELACTGLAWGALAALVGGNELKLYEYDRHDGTIDKLERAVGQFWTDVRDGVEPKAVPDDYGLMSDLYGFTVSTADLTGDNQLPELCAAALRAGARRRAADKEERGAKAVILQKMGDAARAVCTGFELKRTPVHRKEHYVKASSYIKLTIGGGIEDDESD